VQAYLYGTTIWFQAQQRSFFTGSHVQLSRRSPGDAKQEQLLRLYKLTVARERVHRATAHPEEGHAVRIEALQLIAESGSKP
jgi:hypothetical protein